MRKKLLLNNNNNTMKKPKPKYILRLFGCITIFIAFGNIFFILLLWSPHPFLGIDTTGSTYLKQLLFQQQHLDFISITTSLSSFTTSTNNNNNSKKTRLATSSLSSKQTTTGRTKQQQQQQQHQQRLQLEQQSSNDDDGAPSTGTGSRNFFGNIITSSFTSKTKSKNTNDGTKIELTDATDLSSYMMHNKNDMQKLPILRPITAKDIYYYTIRINTWRRQEHLLLSVDHYSECDGISQIQIVWRDTEKQPRNELTKNPLVYIEYHNSSTSFNERYNIIRPTKSPSFNNNNSNSSNYYNYDVMMPLGILNIDDDILRPCDAIESGFSKWIKAPHRMVGFDAFVHNINDDDNSDNEDSWTLSTPHQTNQYSMAKNGFIHRDYFDYYMNHLPRPIFNMVGNISDCDDIAMSLMISSVTGGLPPLLPDLWAIKSRVKIYNSQLRRPNDQLRNMCLNIFAEELGLKQKKNNNNKTPLRTTTSTYDNNHNQHLYLQKGQYKNNKTNIEQFFDTGISFENNIKPLSERKTEREMEQKVLRMSWEDQGIVFMLREIESYKYQISTNVYKHGLLQNTDLWKKRYPNPILNPLPTIRPLLSGEGGGDDDDDVDTQPITETRLNIVAGSNNNSLTTLQKQNITLAPLRTLDRKMYTIRINTWRRNEQLLVSVKHHLQCPGVAQLQIVWCDKENEPPYKELYDISRDLIVVEKHDVNSLNERFNILNISNTPTIGILSIDDDVLRSCDAIDSGFFKWVESPNRMVGFDARTHIEDDDGTWKYGYLSVVEETNFYSMTLPRYSFMHRDYLNYYMTNLPRNIFNTVAKNFNCEDIAMSFMISSLTDGLPPLLADMWAIKTDAKLYSSGTISGNSNHRILRDNCIDMFGDELGLKGDDTKNRLISSKYIHSGKEHYFLMGIDPNALIVQKEEIDNNNNDTDKRCTRQINFDVSLIEMKQMDVYNLRKILIELRTETSKIALEAGLIQNTDNWNKRFGKNATNAPTTTTKTDARRRRRKR